MNNSALETLDKTDNFDNMAHIEQLSILKSMIRIRMVEEEIARRYPEGKMRCPTHLSIGQECVPAVLGALLNDADLAVSTHRAHAHYLGKGGDLKAMLAEIYGKETGCCKGRGGSMHLIDESIGFKGSTAIVGNTIPIGVGLSLSQKLRSDNGITVVFLGDGAIEEGVFYEAANFAVVKNLPVLFVCENNLYSVYSPLKVRQPEGRKINDVARAIGLHSLEGDGNSVGDTHQILATAIDVCRHEQSAAFVELHTYRWREHCGPHYDNDIGYRSEQEFLDWKEKDPIELFKKQLNDAQILDSVLLQKMTSQLEIDINGAFEFAETSPYPSPEKAYSPVFAPAITPVGDEVWQMDNRTLTFAQAINEAMHLAMERDSGVLCYGLGVDDPKRIFGTTKGLQEAFGEERVFDMPTSENGMLGIGIGAALNGLKPVMVHQRLDFFLLAMDQLVNAAAKWFYMFGSQRSVPITIRLMLGRGWGQGPTHSQNLQAWFAHVPGLKVVMPATAADAKGLLLASIFDPNPVVFLEHRWLHHQEGNVPEGWQEETLGKAKILREGSDISLVAMSYQVVEALRAAEALQTIGVSAEVIDLRTVQPIDWDTIKHSVTKTGRLLALDTGALTCSVSSEIVARTAEKQFSELKAPPARIAMPDFPEPTSYGLTKNFHPDARQIVQRVLEMCGVSDNEDVLFAFPEAQHHDVPGNWFKGPF